MRGSAAATRTARRIPDGGLRPVTSVEFSAFGFGVSLTSGEVASVASRLGEVAGFDLADCLEFVRASCLFERRAVVVARRLCLVVSRVAVWG